MGRDLSGLARHYLSNRRTQLILGGLVIVTGLALNWSWLVAAGLAPLLLGVLPCVAMCALGLCMSRMGGQSCSAESSVKKDQDAANVALADKSPMIEAASIAARPNRSLDGSPGEQGAAPNKTLEPTPQKRTTNDA
ncbi:hypothetical protein [Thalassobaculum sp.]|uniref:hypothetical protein n=1 Tax=Thalassobaculum sp. TaxID=2022740 RepID=UPI0032ED16B3